jgi:hypothetical protein
MKTPRKTPPINLSQARLDALAIMPPLSHWPLKPKKFTPKQSEVYRFICERLGVDLEQAPDILKAAHAAKALSYNHDTGMWRGNKYTQWVEMMKAKRRMERRKLARSPEMDHIRNLLSIIEGKGQIAVTLSPKRS